MHQGASQKSVLSLATWYTVPATNIGTIDKYEKRFKKKMFKKIHKNTDIKQLQTKQVHQKN